MISVISLCEKWFQASNPTKKAVIIFCFYCILCIVGGKWHTKLCLQVLGLGINLYNMPYIQTTLKISTLPMYLWHKLGTSLLQRYLWTASVKSHTAVNTLFLLSPKVYLAHSAYFSRVRSNTPTFSFFCYVESSSWVGTSFFCYVESSFWVGTSSTCLNGFLSQYHFITFLLLLFTVFCRYN